MRRLKAVDLDVYMLFDKQTHAVTHQKMENSNDPSNYVSTCQNKVAHGMKLLMDASIFLCSGGKERGKWEVIDLDGYDICFVCEQNVLVDRVFIDISIIMC